DVANHDDDCAGKRRDSIEIGVQHGGNVRDEHVTQHAATDAGQHAEERSHDRVEAVPSAFCVPDTAKSARPAASNVSTRLRSRRWRSGRGDQKNTADPASIEIPRYRHSLSAAGGIAPIRTSRVMPPAVAVANERTSTPKRSSRCLTPAVAPLRAKTNVPTSSSTSSVPVVAYSLNPASV